MARFGNRNSSLLLLLLAIGAAVGCTALRDFIVPPDTQQHREIKQTVARYASLIVDNIQIDGERRAIALRAGRVAAVAAMAELTPLRGTNTRVVDGHGGSALPGFVDGEVELLSAAMLRDGIDLLGVDAEQELGQRLGGGGELLRGDDWVWARNLNQRLSERLTATDLVRLAPDLPVLVTFASGDGALVSRALLNLLPAHVRRPVAAAKGRIGATLTRAVLRALPEPRLSRLKPLLVQVLTDLRDRGITTVQVMSASPLVWRALIDLERDRRLDLRCQVFLDGRHSGTEAVLAEREQAGKASARSQTVPGAWKPRRVELVGVEYWLDGGLADRSAALSEDYADAPGKGEPLPTDAELKAWLARTDRLGLQLALHASGDAALAQAVRLLEGAARPTRSLPLRLNRVTVVRPDLLARLCKLNVVVGMLAPTRRSAALAKARLGPERAKWAAQHGALAAACAAVMGSGVPARRARPWHTIATLSGADRGASAGGQAWSQAKVMGAMSADLHGRPLGLTVGSRADVVVWDHPEIKAGKRPHILMVIVDAAVVSAGRLDWGDASVTSGPEGDPDAPLQPPKMPTPTEL